MKSRYAILFSLAVIAFLAMPAMLAVAQENVTLTVAVVNNPDQRKLLELSDKFQAQHPTIKLSFVMLPENELRDRVTTDISTKAGSFDVVQIGTYETPVWGKNGWLASVDDLMQQYPDNVQPNYDVNDLIKGIRLGLSADGKLYAVPFYGESSMLFYNKKMFAAAGLKMPAEPTWDQVREFARKLNNPAKKQYGIALRGLPGWGEILAPLDSVINTWGGKWFDTDWQPQLTAPEFKDAVNFYVQ
ncbi:MAG: ABC transporter substrate-binding protein, partial [Spirochaetia bacterium]